MCAEIISKSQTSRSSISHFSSLVKISPDPSKYLCSSLSHLMVSFFSSSTTSQDIYLRSKFCCPGVAVLSWNFKLLGFVILTLPSQPLPHCGAGLERDRLLRRANCARGQQLCYLFLCVCRELRWNSPGIRDCRIS